MGDPKKQKKKYSKPTHPWEKYRIDEEKILVKTYGLKNKKEMWKSVSIQKKFADQVKRSITTTAGQVKKEKAQLLEKLNRLGLMQKNAKLDDVLSLSVKDILERRLQTLVFKKGLAKTIGQARQFITHGHITVGTKTITSPAYLVPMSEESSINFSQTSQLSDSEHPERSSEKIRAKQKSKEEAKAEG